MNRTIDFIKQTLKGRTIYRVLFNWMVHDSCKDIHGECIDLAGGGKASYYEYLPKGSSILKTNNFDGEGIDKKVDLDAPLPFHDGEFDGALLFNAIYIMKDPIHTLKEVRRILKPGGKLYLASPFVANEMPEPHDYHRFTAEGLERLLAEAGFKNIVVQRFGERFTSMAYIAHAFFFVGPIRAIVNGSCLVLDNLIPRRMKRNYPFPLGYFTKASV